MILAREEELLKRLQRGETDVFGKLYEQYRRNIFGYCFRLLNDRGKAEDLTHDTFTKAYSSLATLRNGMHFRSWLFTIARNEVYALLRKHNLPLIEDADEIWSEESPEEDLVLLERKEIVRKVLASLKPEYREVIILREFENLSYAEIAVIMSDTESSVKSRLFKARKAMTKKLKPLLEEGED